MLQEEWEQLSPDKKREQLYYQQCRLLEKFRERNAITEEQYQKSLRDLTIKMGIKTET